MMYPPAPWKLQGTALQTLRLVRIEKARPFVPPTLDIIALLPGRTLGVVAVAAYGPGSVLAYHELIVAPALARFGGRVGFWVSHIYVDSEQSIQGGRDIWGLPKQMAQFHWSADGGAVEVRQDEQMLCRLHSPRPRLLLPVPAFVPAFSRRDAALLAFKATATGRASVVSGQLLIPATSPLAALDLHPGGLVLPVHGLSLTVHAPQVVAPESTLL